MRNFHLVLALVSVVGSIAFFALIDNSDQAPSSVGIPKQVSTGLSNQPADAPSPAGKSDEPPELITNLPKDDSSGPFFVGQIDPLRIYVAYLDRANAGDLDAAYALLTALDKCRGVVSSMEELQTEFVDAGLSRDLIEFEKERFAHCEPLFSSGIDAESEYDRWYTVASDGRHALILVRQRNLGFDELRSTVITALSQSYPEPHMYHEAFLAASRLYLEYPEKGVDESRYSAWLLLACSASPQCDRDSMLDQVAIVVSTIQLAEILELESQFSEAIRNQQWESLGL